MEISSNRTDRVYAMQELPSIYYIDRSLYMGYHGHHLDTNSSFSRRVFITSIFASLLKLSLDVAFDFAIADYKASLPPPPGPSSGHPFPQPHPHPSGPTHKTSRLSGSGSSRRVLSISMSSLAGSKSRHLGATSSSPTSSYSKAPSVINARNRGDTDRDVVADYDGESGEGAWRTSADATAPLVKDDNVRGVYAAAFNTGQALLGLAGTDMADIPRRAAVVYSAPSTSITAKSVLSSALRITAAAPPPH
jgi:hypothetical protein